MELGPNAAFVWAAYGAVTLVLGALLLWLMADGVRQRRRLDRLEAGGVRRRSAAHDPTAGS